MPKAPDHLLVQLRRARDHADRHFAEPLDLAQLAGVAAISKYHFHRLFTSTYGLTPAAYVCERRIERAQDLLRATNLTVTEVCHAVGFTSLGSFSSRLREIVGESPTQFQRRYVGGAPRIPGGQLFMWGLVERRFASEEKPAETSPSQGRSYDHQRLPRHRLGHRTGRSSRLLHRHPRLRGRR